MEKNHFKFEEFDLRLETNWLGRNFYFYESATSSSTLLMKDEEKFKNGSVVLVEEQTAGRGRLERTWESFAGQNLTFSLLLSDSSFLSGYPPLLSFVASLAVARALDGMYQLSPKLKWPNDVLVKGKKICGILLESVSSGSALSKIVIGIGVNVNQPYFNGEFKLPPTSVKMENDKSNSREVLLAEILEQLEQLLEVYSVNPEHIIKEWKALCPTIGERITIQQHNSLISGRFEDVDLQGNLILDDNGKIRTINYGDVSLL